MSAHFCNFQSPVGGNTPSPNTTLGRLQHLPDPLVYWDCTSLSAFTLASILPPSTPPLGFTGHPPQIFCYCQHLRPVAFGVSNSHTPSPLGRRHQGTKAPRFSCFRRSRLGAKAPQIPRPLHRAIRQKYLHILSAVVFGIFPTL